MSMFLLGVDPALNSLGYAVIKIDNGRVFYVASGTIKSTKFDSVLGKSKNIYNHMRELVSKYHISSIGIESSFSHINPATAIKLGMVKGIIYAIAASQNIDIVEYAPKKIKKTITGDGNCTKENVQLELQRVISGISFDTNDESDAVAIAITHAICLPKSGPSKMEE